MSDILDKIRKLLELSKSDNENEAAQAAARAAELMLKHEIEEADLEAKKPEAEQKVAPIADEIVDKTRREIAWKGAISHGLARAFGGESYTWRRYDVASRRMMTEDRIIAPVPAMQAIRYMYSYLTAEVDRLADAAYAAEHAECRASAVEPPPARAWKSAFRVGAARTIRDRLFSQRRATHAAARQAGHGAALMVVDRQAEAVVAYERTHHPSWFKADGSRRTATGTSTAGSSSSSGYAAGRAAGESVNLGGGRQLGAGRRQIGRK